MRNNGLKRSVCRASGVLCQLVAFSLVLGLARPVHAYDFTVAQDGTGDFTTVQAAIDAVPKHNPARTSIFIKAGTYVEKITIPQSKPRLTLVGEDRATTIITDDSYTTDRGVDVTDTLTCYVEAKNFGARNITFANTAGDVGQGAFAMWIVGNRAHFRDCAFLGYQDTLFTGGALVYFKRCFLEGQIDFIFGSSTAVFKDCTLHCLGSGSITAADTPEDQPYGLVFKGCMIYGEAPAGTVLLGRALGAYANVVFSNCMMDDVVAPEGWDDIDDPTKDSTAFFAEYNSTGDGADPADRVDWSHQLTTDEDAAYSLNGIFGTMHANMLMTGVPEKPWYSDY